MTGMEHVEAMVRSSHATAIVTMSLLDDALLAYPLNLFPLAQPLYCYKPVAQFPILSQSCGLVK